MKKIGYKIFEDKDDSPIFLFHGLNSSRKIPLGVELTAIQRDVQDGSKGRFYKSGFHIVLSKNDLDGLKKLFKITQNRVVVKVKCANIYEKSNAKTGICLCEKILLTEKAWKNRQPL